MLPKVEKIGIRENESFAVGCYQNKWFERSWHYHSEYELILVTRGFGTRVIGNNTTAFREGDLVLLGGDIPHAWFSDPSFFEEENEAFCESVYVHFDRAIFGNRFASLPEMQNIHQLLNNARYGLKFKESECCPIIDEMNMISDTKGLDRLLKLIQILDMFQRWKYTTIVPKSYYKTLPMIKSTRMKKVHEYVINNYMGDPNIREAAALVEMNVSSFCRFFKRITDKTFSQYVKETRIDFAQQLLINTNLSSNQIGFECGFSSVAYFNQCFKSISKQSPLEYRKQYKVV